MEKFIAATIYFQFHRKQYNFKTLKQIYKNIVEHNNIPTKLKSSFNNNKILFIQAQMQYTIYVTPEQL